MNIRIKYFTDKIERLRYVDGIPLTIEEMHFSREYLYLLMEDLTGSIHSLLQEHGVKLKAAQKSFAICNGVEASNLK